MKAEQSVEQALILLEQMSEDPKEVLRVLDEAEQSAMMQELDVLAKQAATIQNISNLLQVADAILCLAEDRPGLRWLLLEETGVEARWPRKVTIDDQRATTQLNAYAQQRAPQIRNAVIECRAQLQSALQKNTESEYKLSEGKNHDSSKN